MKLISKKMFFAMIVLAGLDVQAERLTCEPARCRDGLVGPRYDSSCPPVDRSDVQGWALYYRCEQECRDENGKKVIYETTRFACCTDRSYTCK